MEAIEFENGELKRYGYQFEINVALETDSMEAFKMLYDKVKTGISRKNIIHDQSEYSGKSIKMNDNTIIGRIEDDVDHDTYDSELVFSIDGEKYTLEDLKKLIGPNVGFNFKLTIYESSENITVEEKVDGDNI